MRFFLTILLIIIFAYNGFSQSYKFKSEDKFSEWIMNYYTKPEPEKLFSAFEYGVVNHKIKEADSEEMVVAFFGSIFRADSMVISEFYEKVKQNNTLYNHFGFVSALWLANTSYSSVIMKEYLRLECCKKYKNDGLENEFPFDIYSDIITDPSQIDIIWADFYATGNSEDIKRIIYLLKNHNEITESAKWSLITNGVNYPKVHEIILALSKEIDNKVISEKLNLVVADINQELEK